MARRGTKKGTKTAGGEIFGILGSVIRGEIGVQESDKRGTRKGYKVDPKTAGGENFGDPNADIRGESDKRGSKNHRR